METELERAMLLIVDVFEKYSERSNKKSMRKRDMKELIQNEMNVGPISKQPKYQRLMADLDCHGDEVVDFPEYASTLRTVILIKKDH